MLIPIGGSIGFETESSSVTRAGFTIASEDRSTLARAGFTVSAERQAPARSGLTILDIKARPTRFGFTLGDLTISPARSSMTVRSGDGFLILADIYPPTIPIGGIGAVGNTYPVQYIIPKLTVGGVEIPIIEFTYEKPAGRLGALLNATVAQFDTAGLDPLAPVNFGYRIIYDIPTMAEHYFPRMTNGKLLGRQHEIQQRAVGRQSRPADTVQISAIDLVGDKFTLRPNYPVTMYDPQKTTPSEVKFDAENALRRPDGSLILTSLEECVGLTAYDALTRAYTNHNGMFTRRPMSGVGAGGSSTTTSIQRTVPAILGSGVGLGFERFVTNIPNYPISRVDFTIEGGWHEGVLPLFAMYGPLFFDILNVLFIINAMYPLPAGFVPRAVNNKDYSKLALILPVKDYTNSVILSYKAFAAEVLAEEGLFYTYRFDQETQTQGTYGQLGYMSIETTRKIKEARSILDPGTVITEFEEESDVKTYAAASPGLDDSGALVLIASGSLQLTHRETQINIYDGNGLKTSHHKTIEAGIMSWVDGTYDLTTVMDEKCFIEWAQTDDPNVMIQTRSTTRIECLIAPTENVRTFGSEGNVRSVYPVVVAQFSGVAIDEGFGAAFTAWRPMRTITETLRHTKGNQFDVEVLDYDNLTGTMRVSITQPRTGQPITSLYGAKMRHILLEDAASIAEIGPRIPAGVNAGELPRARALQLGSDVLNYLKNPRYDAQVIIAGLDLTLDRGSVIVPRKRDTDANHFIVTGTAETGRPKGNNKGFEIIMTLTGQQVNEGS